MLSCPLVFSQSLPITFDESTDAGYYFTCFDCNFGLTTDPDNASNTVGELTSYNYVEYASAQTLTLDLNIDLSDNNNNTITFRINPLNGTGSGTHLLRFEGGSPLVELPFTTIGSGWQTVSVDFGPGLTSYHNLIIFPDFGFENFSVDVYLIDDIQGGTNVTPPPTPTQAAPVPTIDASKTQSVYSDSYTNIPFLYAFGASNSEVDIESNGNNAIKVDLGYVGAGYSSTNVSSDLYVHFDYWTTNATKFDFNIMSDTPFTERKYTIGIDQPLVKDAWQSVFIPLSHFSSGAGGVDLTDMHQYIFRGTDGGIGTIYVDNIYYTSESNLSLKDFDLSSFKVHPNPTKSRWNIETSNQIMSSVNVFNVLGKRVMTLSPNSNTVSIDGYDLKAGLYFAQIETANGLSSLKLVKQ